MVGESDDSVLSSPWFVTGLAGGGMLLAGALLLGLRTRRRSQFRTRRPGRTIASPDPALAPIEKSAAAATAAAVSVEFVDHALRRLAAHVAAARSSMPPLAAVELGHRTLTLHLSAAADLPAPWHGTTDRTHWHIDGPSLDTAAADETVSGQSSDGPKPDARHLGVEDLEAPYPLLVTIGTSDTGETWMLNCEELGAIAISGDHDNAKSLMRHLAAQIAVNPWSSRVTATCIGVAAEVASMDDRLTCLAGTEELGALIHDALRAAEASVARSSAHDTDASTARTGYLDDDTWPARLLLVDAAPIEPATRELLDQLVGLIAEHPGQASSAVVTSDASTADGVAPERVITLNVTRAGRVNLDEAGLDLVAVGLTSEEADGCARLYAQRAELDDAPVPADDPDDSTIAADIEADRDADAMSWSTYADKAGALREEYTRPRDADHDADRGSGTVSILDGDDDDYLRSGALTEDDLQAVAPHVPSGLRAQIEAADRISTATWPIGSTRSVPAPGSPCLDPSPHAPTVEHWPSGSRTSPSCSPSSSCDATTGPPGTRSATRSASRPESAATTSTSSATGSGPTRVPASRTCPTPTNHLLLRRGASTSIRSTTAYWSMPISSSDSASAPGPAEERTVCETSGAHSDSSPVALLISCDPVGGPGSSRASVMMSTH